VNSGSSGARLELNQVLSEFALWAIYFALGVGWRRKCLSTSITQVWRPDIIFFTSLAHNASYSA